MLLKSLAEFFQLPSKIFDKLHKRIKFENPENMIERRDIPSELHKSDFKIQFQHVDKTEVLTFILTSEFEFIYLLIKVLDPFQKIFLRKYRTAGNGE